MMKNILTILFILLAFGMKAQLIDENFDSSNGSWVSSSDMGAGYWEWGDPTATQINDDHGTGGNAWVTGLAGDFAVQEFNAAYLTSPSFNLSSLTSEGSVSLAINYDLGTFNDGFEDFNDVVFLEYSTDGMFWSPLGSSGTGINWYNTTDQAWSQNSGGWITAAHDLPMDALGQSSVSFRFVIFSIAPTGQYGSEGFAIDDFQILETNVSGGSGGSLPNEDFELSDGGWLGSTLSGEDYWEWGVPVGTQINDDNSGGGSAWVTGLNGDFTVINSSETVYLTSAAYDLSSLGAEGSISFALNIDLASGDQAHMEYLIDDGVSTWTVLGASASGTNWYDDSVNETWSVNSGGWMMVAHDLPFDALGASSVLFRIVMVSSAPAGSYNAEGLAIDDFQILSTNTEGEPVEPEGGIAGTTQILTMNLSGEIFPAVIDSTSNSVQLFVFPTTDVTALAPTFTLSDGATVDLASGSTQNFSSSVTYTVTSSNGMENTAWEVSANVPDINLSVHPQSGLIGSTVTILGRGFSTTASENTLTFGGISIPVATATNHKLTFEVPTNASLGVNDLSVSVNGLNTAHGTTFNVLASNVAGTFEDYKLSDFNLNASSYVSSMQVGDIDNDGDMDLVFDNETILNIATLDNGRILSTVNKVTDRNAGTDSFDDLTFVDVDQDGFLDIVAGGLKLGWYKNNGDGTWADEVIIDESSFGYTIRVFDIDGDFDFDILAKDDFVVFSFTNDGNGSFALNDKMVPSQLGPIIDWDADGDLDMLIAGSSKQHIILASNDGLGNFTEETLISRSTADLSNFQIGDLDNDGDLDFIIATANLGTSISTMAYVVNNGDGTYGSETSFITEGIFDTDRLELADLNNDGFLDVARTRSDGSTNSSHIYLTSEALNYSSSEVIDSSSDGLDIVLVDIEGDGDMDILHEASQSGGYFPLIIKLLNNADIESFALSDEVETATINSTTATVSIEVNADAEVAMLTAATMEISPGASISPDPATVEDYSSPVVYTVTADDGTPIEEPSQDGTMKDWTVTVSQVPSVPTLSVTNVGQSSADASWTVANDAATNYELQLSTTDDFSSLVAGFDPLAVSGSSSTTLSNLSAGTMYYARIRGSNDLGTFSDYSTASVFLTTPSTPVATLPTEVRSESFVANWDASVGAEGYSVEVSTDNFSSTVFIGNTTDEVTQLVTGLSQGTEYQYRIIASNTTGSSPYSNSITLTTNIVPQSVLLDNTSVNENQVLGTVVGALNTVDNDDILHTYELVTGTGDDDNAFFDIDGTNLITNEVFNFEIGRTQYSVRIQSTDTKEASVAASFLIDVLDLNDAPSSISLVTAGFSPTGFDPAGTDVGVFSTTDDDENDDNSNITLELIEGGNEFTITQNPNAGNVNTLLVTQEVFTNEEDLTIPISVRATDNRGASVTESFDITIRGFVDTEAPEIAAFPTNSATFLSGGPESLTLGLTIVDEFRLSEVKFHSRLLTESDFTVQTLTSDNSEYTVTIVQEDLGVAGIEYFFEAIDAEDNNAFTDLKTMALAFPEAGENAPKVESVTKFGRTIDKYQVISIPFFFENPTDKRVDVIFNEYSEDEINREYRIIKWDPALGEMGELTNMDAASTIELGEGYFFISATEKPITIERANINLEDPFPLELEQGWNLVGNPYNLDINWTSVLNKNDAGHIVGSLRVLDPENPETWPESDILKELEGAFVFTSQAITLDISYTDASISFGGLRMARTNDVQWDLPITVEQNGNLRNGGIGMDDRAKPSLDPYDEPVLPKWLEFLEIAFLHPGERFDKYNRDVVPFTEYKVWEFEVSSSEKGSSVLKWDKSSTSVPNLQLYNLDTDEIIDMTQQSSYEFELNETTSFKVLYSNDPDDTFRFEKVQVLDAYPNPFTNSFNIPIRLPENGSEYSINVDLLDIHGRIISAGSTLNAMGGNIEYNFSAQDEMEPGVYFYRVNLIGQQGENNYVKRILVQ